MARTGRIIRNVVLGTVVVAAGGVGFLTLTQPGRDRLASVASGLASTPERKVIIRGLDGIWSGPLTVDSVVVEDADGAWLALRDVAADISYTALLRRSVEADTLRVGHIEVARQPLAQPAAEDGGAFSLPVDIRIDAIDLPQITLGAALAGEPATLAARSRLVALAEPLHIETETTVHRTDGRDGDLSLSLVFAPAENRLDIRAEGAEPRGGVVANLLGLPGEPSMSIAVEGSGPPSDWRGQGAIAVDETVAARLSGRRQATADGNRIEVKGDGEFARFMPEQFRAIVEGQTLIDFAGTLRNDGGIEVEAASLETAAVKATAEGTVDPQGVSNFRLAAAAQGEPVALAFGEGAGRVALELRTVEATVSGTGDKPVVDAAATLARLETSQATLTNVGVDLSSSGFDVATRTGPMIVSVSAASARSDNPTIEQLLAGQAVASVSADIGTDAIRIDSASLTTDALGVSGAGSLSRADGSLALDIKGNARSAALPAAAGGLLGDDVTVSGRIARSAEGAIDLSALELASGPLTAQGTVRLAGGDVDASLTGGLGDLSGLSANVAGQATFSLSAKGPLVAPTLDLKLASDRMESGGRAITGLSLTASGVADPANPAADVKLSGKVGDQALDGTARLATTGGRRQVSGLQLSLGGTSISGDLDLDDAFLPTGSIRFDVPDLGPLAALALQQVSGQAKGHIVFETGAGGPGMRVDATIPSFGRDNVTGRDVRIEADIANYLAAPAIAGRVTAGAVNAGGASIANVDIKLSRDGVWTGFNGGATVNAIPATAKGRAKFEDGAATIELTSGQATVQGIAAQIAGPSTIVSAGGTTKLENLALSVGGGRAVINGAVSDTLAIEADLAGIPASLANNFVPGLGASGTVSGNVKVSGQPSAPAIAYDVRLANAETSQTREAGFGAMQVTSRGTLVNDALSFQATVGDGSGMTLSGGGTVGTAGAKALNLKFDGKVPFGFLTRRLAGQGLSLTGAADVAVTVGGTAAAPVIGGTVRSSGARFVDASSGIAINDMTTEINLGGGVARLERFTGTISSGGTVTGSGTVAIDAAAGFPADLNVKVVNGRYTDGRVVTANFSGDIAVKGPLVQQPTLSGRIDLGRTIITVPERMSPALSRLNVQHRNATAAIEKQAAALKPAQAGGSTFSMLLDLTVNAPQQFFVQGRGLDAEMGGTVRLTGPASSPQAVGQFELKRGRLSVLDRRLDFTEGTVSFAGSMVPEIAFSASTAVQGSTIIVNVSGEASDPKFVFTSSPALPEDEVLARLVFGRSLTNLSPLQIAQLATAAAQLAGVGGSTTLLDKIRNKIGVDDLDVKTDGSGATSVQVGKYLNDRTYVTIEKGSKPGDGKAAINLDVGKGLKLRGEASEDGSTKGGIFFEREY